MTAPNPAGNEHCGHECVCNMLLSYERVDGCKNVTCNCDTRTRPTPQPQPAERTQSERNLCDEFILTRKELAHIYAGFFRYENILNILAERGTVEHDTRIRKEGADAALKTIEDHICSKQMMSSGVTEHKLWLWSEPLLELIESLRAQSPKKEGE